MKVLVTGATGFIGLALLKALHEAAHDTCILTRDVIAAERKAPGVEAFSWHSAKEIAPPEAFSGVAAVVNLAGETVAGRWSDAQRKAIRDSRVDGTRNLVAGIRAASTKPDVLISTSAVGYYGDRGDEVLTEESAPGEGFLAEVCRDWEAAAYEAEQPGVRVACLRFGIVMGPGGGALEQLFRVYRLGLGGPVGSGKQWWPWVHRADVVGTIVHALTNDVQGALNVSAPNPVRQREFAKTLGRVVGRPSFIPAPEFAIKLALGGFSNEILSSRRALPRRTEQAGYTFRFPEIEDALRDIA